MDHLDIYSQTHKHTHPPAHIHLMYVYPSVCQFVCCVCTCSYGCAVMFCMQVFCGTWGRPGESQQPWEWNGSWVGSVSHSEVLPWAPQIPVRSPSCYLADRRAKVRIDKSQNLARSPLKVTQQHRSHIREHLGDIWEWTTLTGVVHAKTSKGYTRDPRPAIEKHLWCVLFDGLTLMISSMWSCSLGVASGENMPNANQGWSASLLVVVLPYN
jgi:hypothetical protein